VVARQHVASPISPLAHPLCLKVEHQLYKWECHMVEGMAEPGPPTGSPVTYEGAFLRAILDLFSRVLALDPDTAVIVTGIVSRLCQCPDHRLHTFLMDTTTVDPVGGKSLPNIIFEVSDNAEKVMASIPDSKRMLESARNVDPWLHARTGTDEIGDRVQLVLAWQEFLKELVAIVEMKSMLFPDLP
jgi:hypothetical protein